MSSAEKDNSLKQEHSSATPSLSDHGSEIDLLSFHEQNAGRLIIDPGCVYLLFV